MCFGFRVVYKVPSYQYDRNDAKDAECKLSKSPTEGHPKGHAFIFGEVDQEPTAKDAVFLPQVHMSLDPNLENLVNDQYTEDSNKDYC